MTGAEVGLLVAGVVTGAGGALLKGRAGDLYRKRVLDIAETPGLDVDKLSREALTGQLDRFDLSSDLAARTARANQAGLLGQEEASLPGLGAARQRGLETVLSFLGEDRDWLAGIQRRGAALGLGRGFGGSPAAQMGTLRLSDTESMARKQTGLGMLGALISSMRIANSPGVQAFLGPSSSDLINIRGQERVQKMNLLTQAAGIPGQTAAWAGYLSGVGGMLAGMGSGGFMGGGGGGVGSTMGSGGQTFSVGSSGGFTSTYGSNIGLNTSM